MSKVCSGLPDWARSSRGRKADQATVLATLVARGRGNFETKILQSYDIIQKVRERETREELPFAAAVQSRLGLTTWLAQDQRDANCLCPDWMQKHISNSAHNDMDISIPAEIDSLGSLFPFSSTNG